MSRLGELEGPVISLARIRSLVTENQGSAGAEELWLGQAQDEFCQLTRGGRITTVNVRRVQEDQIEGFFLGRTVGKEPSVFGGDSDLLLQLQSLDVLLEQFQGPAVVFDEAAFDAYPYTPIPATESLRPYTPDPSPLVANATP